MVTPAEGGLITGGGVTDEEERGKGRVEGDVLRSAGLRGGGRWGVDGLRVGGGLGLRSLSSGEHWRGQGLGR